MFIPTLFYNKVKLTSVNMLELLTNTTIDIIIQNVFFSTTQLPWKIKMYIYVMFLLHFLTIMINFFYN